MIDNDRLEGLQERIGEKLRSSEGVSHDNPDNVVSPDNIVPTDTSSNGDVRPLVKPSGTDRLRWIVENDNDYWWGMATSVRGKVHQRNEKRLNEDCVGFAYNAQGDMIAVVSDGAGSASQASDGSLIVVDSLLSWFQKQSFPESHDVKVWTPIMHQALQYALDMIQQTVERETKRIKQSGETPVITIKNYNSTVSLVIVSRSVIVAVQVGDGLICAFAPDNKIIMHTKPYRGVVPNSTEFLTSNDAVKNAVPVVDKVKEAVGITLITDGLLALASPDNGTSIDESFHKDWLDQLKEHRADLIQERCSWLFGELVNLIKGPESSSKNTLLTDDISLVVMYRHTFPER